jgi:hypothetical protein
MSAAMVSIPSQIFCNRMFSFDECWLLPWLAIGIVIVWVSAVRSIAPSGTLPPIVGHFTIFIGMHEEKSALPIGPSRALDSSYFSFPKDASWLSPRHRDAETSSFNSNPYWEQVRMDADSTKASMANTENKD